MKKLIAMLLALVMLLSLAACGSSGAEEKGNDALAANPTEPTAQQTDPAAQDTTGEPAGQEANLQTEMESILGTAIAKDVYELRYMDEEQVSLELIDAEYVELDYVITVGEGTKLQLPCAYSEALNAGWVSDTEWEETQEGNTVGGGTHTDASGNTIGMTIQNPTEENMNLTDLWITGVTAGNGHGYTAAFEVSGISEGSTMANVVSALGQPYYIVYYVDEDYVSLKFEYDAADGGLNIYFDPETALVSALGYSYTADIG